MNIGSHDIEGSEVVKIFVGHPRGAYFIRRPSRGRGYFATFTDAFSVELPWADGFGVLSDTKLNLLVGKLRDAVFRLKSADCMDTGDALPELREIPSLDHYPAYISVEENIVVVRLDTPFVKGLELKKVLAKDVPNGVRLGPTAAYFYRFLWGTQATRFDGGNTFLVKPKHVGKEE